MTNTRLYIQNKQKVVTIKMEKATEKVKAMMVKTMEKMEEWEDKNQQMQLEYQSLIH